MKPPPRIDLSVTFARRMASLSILAGAVIAFSAPTAYYVVGRRELLREGKTLARQAARVVKEVAESRGTLWRYDSIQILEGLGSFDEEADLAKVLLLDARGHVLPVDLPVGDGEVPLFAVWAVAPVQAHNRTLARLAVAMDPYSVLRSTVMLFFAFGLIGWALAVLIYRRATNEVFNAERQVRALVRGLETARAGLEADLGEATRRIATIAERTTKLLEEDRAEVARDLHDGVGQSLYALKLRLELLADDLPSQDLRVAAERTAVLVDEAISEVRSATKALVPPALERLGLAGAVRAACDLAGSSSEVEIDLLVGELPNDLPPEVASACYRVIQEGLTNAVKHSGAKRVEVRLGTEEGVLRIAVRDDGHGFDPASVRRGVGLDGMSARVEALGGAVDLQSKEGQGTNLEARVPVSQ